MDTNGLSAEQQALLASIMGKSPQAGGGGGFAASQAQTPAAAPAAAPAPAPYQQPSPAVNDVPAGFAPSYSPAEPADFGSDDLPF